MSIFKNDDPKTKGADKPEPKPEHKPEHKSAGAEAKAPDVPRTKDGEIDLAKLKADRREKPGEEPAAKQKAARKPAKVHPRPHLKGTTHVAGEDPEDTKDEMKEAGAVAVEDPPPETDEAQVLYGLRKEGRLFRCSQAGLATLLIEADDAEQAREAFCAEHRRLAGDEPEELKASKKAAPAAGPTLVPAGMALVPAENQPPKVDKGAVSVVKLAP